MNFVLVLRCIRVFEKYTSALIAAVLNSAKSLG